MAGDNARKVAASLEAFNRGDYDAAFEFADPDAEWVLPPALSADTCAGVDAIREFWDGLREAFAHVHVEPQSFEEEGGFVVTELTVEGTGAGSGLPIGTRLHALTSFREDGRWHRVEWFLDRRALLDAGRRSRSGGRVGP